MDRFRIGFDEKHIPPGAAPEECYRAYLFGERDGIVKDAATISIDTIPHGGLRITDQTAGKVYIVKRKCISMNP